MIYKKLNIKSFIKLNIKKFNIKLNIWKIKWYLNVIYRDKHK